MDRYLTKSRFKLAIDCPAKLYYTNKPIYPDSSQDNPFLEALAEGGFQVGELAKCYFPGGTDIIERGYDIPLAKTNELLENDSAIIYEAAFKYKNLFIRTDILEKNGNEVNLYEVKAKSIDGRDSGDMLNKSGYLDSEWKDYVYDVAFQKYVITNAFPEWHVKAHLMLADKNAVATVNGLNQKFQLTKVEGERSFVEIIGGTSKDDLGEEILIRVNVDDLIDMIYEGTDSKHETEMRFEDWIDYLADHYEKDEKIHIPINSNCKDCEYHATEEEKRIGKLSGFKECWKLQLNWTDDEFEKPLVFDVWNFRGKQKCMEEGIFHIEEMQKEHIGDIQPGDDGSLSSKERQWLQVEKIKNNDSSPYIDIEGLQTEFDQFVYPLHFIDFETSMVAIPFFKGRRPYEQTAFQFSHHIVYEDLTIEHKGQYLCTEKGKFPNFEFIRHLKKELENDKGSIFRYADHENTVVNQVLAQIMDTPAEDLTDKNELIQFIQSISHGANHKGDRDMIDLLKLVRKYYYHPLMRGSNSIKSVLPAVLNSSEYIKNKYSQPVYGSGTEIESLNFKEPKIWVGFNDDGSVKSPYDILDPIFDNLAEEQIEEFLMGDKLADGGAAMTAYAKMQFMEISDLEREHIINGLLKYCELDTLAMVMIWEYWNKSIY